MSGIDDHEVLASLHDDWNDYSWASLSLLRAPDGSLSTYDDGGCSCYGMFDHFEPTEVEPLTVDTWEAFLRAVDTFPTSDAEDKAAFILAASDALHGATTGDAGAHGATSGEVGHA